MAGGCRFFGFAQNDRGARGAGHLSGLFSEERLRYGLSDRQVVATGFADWKAQTARLGWRQHWRIKC